MSILEEVEVEQCPVCQKPINEHWRRRPCLSERVIMRVNDTKYDLCVCGHPRSEHKWITGIGAAVKTDDTHTCKSCNCKKFVLSYFNNK